MTRLFIALFAIIVSFNSAQAQAQKFLEEFKQVKLHLANHKEDLAIPILEELLKVDKGNSNIAYLLGYCYVKQEKNIDRAIRLLEKASRSYSEEYDPTSLNEKRVSEYVFYYLIIAYSLDGQCDEAKSKLNKFYEIYSYYDEWYLIEGQKWLRECGTKNWRDKEDSTKEEVVEKLSELPIENTESVESLSQEVAKVDSKPKAIETIDQPENNPFKDRLMMVEEDKETNTYKPVPVDREKTGVVTKTIKYSTSSILYGVQVAAFIEPKFTRDFPNLKNVDVYIDQNGVFRYVIGRFSYKTQAEKLLEYVKAANYSDAFIVDINGDKYSEEVVTIGDESINRRITGKVDFRVQIGAFKEQIPEHLARQYLIIDKIKETKVNDFTVLSIGSFRSYGDAAEYRDKIQIIGVEDAFIVAFNYDRKIPIDEAEQFLIQERLKQLDEIGASKKKKKRPAKEKEEEFDEHDPDSEGE